MRRKSPVTVQQWIDSLPVVSKPQKNTMNKNEPSGNVAPTNSPVRQGMRGILLRDASIQSDDASNCSSVESVLELRKPDPEAVLLGLGFGPPKATDYLTRIPKRFLQPSRLNGIDIGKFLEEQAEIRMMEENFMHHYLASCSQGHSIPNSPSHVCDSQQSGNNLKKTSF